MKLKNILLTFTIFCIVHEISSTFPCNCFGEGKDVCNCKQNVRAPRPYPTPAPSRPSIHKPILKSICKHYEPAPDAPQFNPIGDVCNCGQRAVKPAPYPILRPCPCRQGLPKFDFLKPSCSCSSCTSNNKESRENIHDGCGEIKRAPKEFHFEFDHKKRPAPEKPKYANADVVSVAIAQRLADSAKNSISERQLQYGSQKEPTLNYKNDDKKVSRINEDYLYDTKGHVLEIKSNLFRKQAESESESSSESNESRKKKKYTPVIPANLKYDEIGYGTYHSHHPKYVVVKNKEANHDCKKQEPRHKHFHKHSRTCGCAQDLLVEGTSLSEQTVSYENESNDQYNREQSYFST